MKNLILFSIISLLSVSCGQKEQASTAKFKIFSGNIVDPVATFPGGLMVIGRKMDDSQSFMLRYTPDLELELSKGSWEFATIGWMGANPIEGNQQCSHQKVEISSDNFTVNFNMNYQACLEALTSDGKRFVDLMFYDIAGGTFNGFKKLNVQTCPNLDTNCAAQTTPGSFRIEMRTELKGVKMTAGTFSLLGSNCIAGITEGVSNLTPPHGGKNGFIGMKISTFSDQNCTAFVSSYHFDHGFGEVLNKSFYENGTYVQRRAALSVDTTTSNSAEIALAPFYGVHSDSIILPPVPTTGNGLYYYKGAAMLGVSPYTLPGHFMFYDASVPSWSAIENTASVKLILQL